MNKNDRIIVVLLFAALIGWTIFGKKFMTQKAPPPADTNQTAVDNAASNSIAKADDISTNNQVSTNVATAKQPQVAPKAENPAAVVTHKKDQEILTLENKMLNLSFSSWGGGITKAKLIEKNKDKLIYPETNDDKSGPLVLNFTNRQALAYNDLPGLSSQNDFELTRLSGIDGIEIKGKSDSGLSLDRTAALTNGYVLTVTDIIKNESDKSITVPESQMNIGSMNPIKTRARRGIIYLGAESRNIPEGKTKAVVTRWDRSLPKLFRTKGGDRAHRIDSELIKTKYAQSPLEWIAVKNKFFVQVLIPNKGGVNGCFFAEREPNTPRLKLNNVSAAISFKGKTLAPSESFKRVSRYYVGPKKYSEMKALGGDQDHIILHAWPFFGWWRMACAGLLWLMNGLYAITHNYGVAIILLTIIIKIVFWPATHKGTESMKKMKEIQPELKILREKYKDDPKKIQEKQMLLYRQHGVNPVAGCLPMIIQMPVFIALYTVLRNTVELRFASFLWIHDLCEPEGLLNFGFSIPIIGWNTLNILPLIMTATTILQQKMTPTAGDPKQQKMMQFMPLMMLFIFYNMASALVLYWTVNQVLSILQLYLQQRKDKTKA